VIEIFKQSFDSVIEVVNGGFLSHSTDLSFDNPPSLRWFQEYAPCYTVGLMGSTILRAANIYYTDLVVIMIVLGQKAC